MMAQPEMTHAMRINQPDHRIWGMAGSIALGVHIAVVAVAIAWVRPAEPPVPEPVVLIDMPPEAAAAPAAEMVAQARPVTPPIDVPRSKAPLPADPVILPPPLPIRAAQTAQVVPAPPAVSAPPPATASAVGTVAGSDPKARKQEMDYFALLAAHLNRKKSYPIEAKKARQEGIVTVRFTVDRDGQVSGLAIKRGSGHDILDRATLDLVQRVAPLPRMPAAMQRDSLTLALPIEYALKIN
jgi:protein TonB